MSQPAGHWIVQAVESLERQLARIELTIAAGAFTAMLGISLIEIIGRNVFSWGIPGGDVFLRHTVLWVALPGAVLAVVTQRHIQLDPFALSHRSAWRRWTYRPYNIFSAMVCAALAWAATRYWWEDWRSVSVTEVWGAALSSILPVSFLLMTLHFLARVVIGPKPEART